MPDDDPYWENRCKCGDGKTNLECVAEAAEATGTPLEEAMKIFRPTAVGQFSQSARSLDELEARTVG